MSKPPSHYTTQEVAEAYRVTAATVAVWCRLGQMEAVKQPGGKRWLVIATKKVREAVERQHGTD